MVAITSAGIGSGLDINGLVGQLMAAERQPLTALDKKEATYQAKLAAYGSVKSALTAFNSAVGTLNNVSKFRAMVASSGDNSIYTASGSAQAVPGSYSVEVKQLAQAQTVVSKTFTNSTDTVGTGTLTFYYGTDNAGVFTINAAKAAQTVTIDTAHGSLSGVRDAINAANIGVSATLVNVGGGYKLSLTSKDSGAANSLKVLVSNDADSNNVNDAGLSQLAYDPAGALGTGKNLTQTVVAQNATLKVNGVDNISKASNVVTDVVQGVTLNLIKQSTLNTPTTLTVSRDTGGVAPR